MSSLPQIAPEVQSPYELGYVPDEPAADVSPEDWSAHCAATRRPDPPSGRDAYSAPLQWVESQVAYHKSQSHAELDYHDLVATALNDVAIVLRGRRPRTVADLLAQPGHPYSGIDLAAVAVPEHRASDLAALLDEDAAYYLLLGTDLGRLAAHAILFHSEGAEYHGSRTVAEYHASEDAWEAAAAEAAAETVYGEAAGLDNPLW